MNGRVKKSKHRKVRMKTAGFVTRPSECHDNTDLLILAPNMEALPAGAESVVVALPVHNSNAWLETLVTPATRSDARIVASIFAADPFLDPVGTLVRVRRAGIGGVAIWPSVGVFGGEPDFDAVGLGFEREVEFASTATKSGFEVTATVFDASQARRMLDVGVHRLLLHAPLGGPPPISGGDIAGWLQSVFPDGWPDGVETYLYAPDGQDQLASVHGLVDGFLAPALPERAGEHAAGGSLVVERDGICEANIRAERLPFVAHRDDVSIVGAAVGTGAAAHAVAKGGADFIVALSAGRFRMMGAPSTAAYLPLRDTNSFVDAFAREEILLHSRIPVFLGAFASDPHRSVAEIVARAADAGYQGIANFPTVARYSGGYRARLEASGFGIQREFELVERARKAGLATLAYARDFDGALHFAELGTEVLCLQFGSGASRSAIPSPEQIEDIAGKAGVIIRRVRAKHPAVICLLSGGLILSPKIMVRICGLAKADGYIGGSAIDQIPLEASIEDRTAEFKTAPAMRYELESIEKQIRLYRSFGLVTTASDNQTVHERVKRLASGDHPVIISGQSGTGKSLLARFIHSIGPFSHRRLENLSLDVERGGVSEAALAGLAAGIAGNRYARLGWFQLLSGQGLVLDHLEKAGPTTQALLLEALDSGRYHPLGGTGSLPFEVRLILTSREPLPTLRTSGRLAEDLYLKLRPAEIELHPLKERPEDIPIIVEFLLHDIGRGAKGRVLEIEHAASRALQTYDWPGNARELRSFLEEAVLVASGRKIMLEDLDVVQKSRGIHVAHPKEITEQDWIADALRRHRFRRADTAAFLGISRKTLYSKIKRFHLLGER
jgi:predicted TIM-barrel enzyme/DNA-binding NtrC family response regulator